MAVSLRALDYSVLQQCMHCGLCLPSCPTYDTTKHERNSPRGRISLMRTIADGGLDVTKAFADEMSYCLGCLACQSACPAGVNYAELFETARNDIESQPGQRGMARRALRQATLGGLFMSPRALRRFGRVVRFYQRSGLERLLRTIGVMRLLPAPLRRLEPQLPPMAAQFSDRVISPVEHPAGDARYRVALLTGCVQDLVFSGVNRDTADVLRANGCRVDTPPEQPCCGSLHAHNGERELARTLARRMIELFPPERYDAIISNAGGCGSHLRHYAPLLADDSQYAERAQAWDCKLRDVHEWLAEIGWRTPTAAPFSEAVTLTYHDSCHLAHGQKVTRQPRDIVRTLPGVTFVELPEANVCCGAAGIYAVTQPAQADLQLRRKLGHIRASGASIVTTANPGCHLQVARGLAQDAAAIQVVHPVSLLAGAYRRETSSSHSHEVPQP
jgi:glycolate oxidase iron-sulfur subunit